MTEPDFLRRTREGYDRTARAYAERFQHHLDDKPVDQAILSAFAGMVRRGTNRRVADVGCGTGVATAVLHGLGVDAFGIDLSPNMIGEAARRNPRLVFSVGSMSNLDLSDGSVGGVCAWYSIIHLPDEELTAAMAEFRRVLAPGGLVLLGFQVGDEPRVLTAAFDQVVELTFHRRRPDAVCEVLADAGFTVCAQLLRAPEDDGLESTPQAYVIARKR